MEPLIGCPRYRGVLQHGFRHYDHDQYVALGRARIDPAPAGPEGRDERARASQTKVRLRWLINALKGMMEPLIGFEPMTLSLRMRCSTD
jgi:hypothetical protein